jgi:hypothetical protein
MRQTSLLRSDITKYKYADILHKQVSKETCQIYFKDIEHVWLLTAARYAEAAAYIFYTTLTTPY